MFKISTIHFSQKQLGPQYKQHKIISKTASAVCRHKMALLAAGPHEATTASLSNSTELYRCALITRNYHLSSHLMLYLIHVISLLSLFTVN